MRRSLPFLLLLCLGYPQLHADAQPFDLMGPKIDVHVKRGEVTLPVSQTANLQPGDRLWIHPDLPEDQAAHIVLVVAFLRGSTNPPPAEWFTRVETWNREARNEGVFIGVPDGAQQALLFLAPATGGDFNTLRSAVRGRPGSFVRAAQDLQAASWERMRLEAYLESVRISSQYDPAALKSRTEMAARSLGIKVNEGCFQRPADQQAACLSQTSEGMVLDDSSTQSLVNQLASGNTLDLMNELSSSPMGKGGEYSTYVGAIVDTAKILSSLRTAHFQYIPALALPKADTLNLRLNMPLSFRNPKSVVVVALPPVGPARPEPLHPVNPADSFCARKPELVLPAEGAPLFFATSLAHNLVLHIESSETHSAPLDVPLAADASKGGLALTQPIPSLLGGEWSGEVRGKWGFDDWIGPRYLLVSAQQGKWTLAEADRTALVVGRDDVLHLDGQNPACIDKIEALTAAGHSLPLAWKPGKPRSIEITVPLKDAAPGPVKIALHQFGLSEPDHLDLVAYEAAASLDRLTLASGDKTALLQGTRLDEVAKAEVNGIPLLPGRLNRVENFDQLQLNAGISTTELAPAKPYTARVELKDGRVLSAPVTVLPPRPQITLLNTGVQNDPAAPPPVQLGSTDDLPVDGKLVFFLRSDQPANFPRDEKVEVAAADASFQTTLSVSDGSLMLADAHTAVGSFEPRARFGASAFGPLRLRAVSANGAQSDWQMLGTLVRFPGFKDLRCPRTAAKPCLLTGSNLFLAAAFSATPTFDNPVEVDPQFTGTQIAVPHTANGVLYLRLRDDPATVQTLSLPVTLVAGPAAVAPPTGKTPPAPADDKPDNSTDTPDTTPAAPASAAPASSAQDTTTPPTAANTH
jgi:hypothetical protein